MQRQPVLQSVRGAERGRLCGVPELQQLQRRVRPAVFGTCYGQPQPDAHREVHDWGHLLRHTRQGHGLLRAAGLRHVHVLRLRPGLRAHSSGVGHQHLSVGQLPHRDRGVQHGHRRGLRELHQRALESVQSTLQGRLLPRRDQPLHRAEPLYGGGSHEPLQQRYRSQ